MNDGVLKRELKMLHDRIDEVALGNQSYVDSIYDLRLRQRAFQTIINRSYLLKLLFNPKRIEKIMVRLDKQEIILNNAAQQAARKAAAERERQERRRAIADKQNEELSKKEKRLKKKLIRKGVDVHGDGAMPEEVEAAINELKAEGGKA